MLFLAALDIQAIVDWIMRHIGPIFIGIVFFVLPLLRSLKEQAAKKKAMEARGGPPAEEDGEVDGSEAWKALMRGETREVARPPAVEPPPLARNVAPPPPARPVEGSETQPTLSGRLSDFADAPTEDEEESTLDEEGLARELNDRLLREELQRRSDFLAREKESPARKTVTPETLTTIDATDTVKLAAVDRSAGALLFGPGADRRDALRRALVAREVLGPPLALRTHIDALGPTALSP
jgi:hypothetical protein